MSACDSVTQESQKILSTCYTYQYYFPAYSEGKEALFNLINEAVHDKPVFSAARFFDLNRSSMFTLYGSIATYFIIIIQFNQNMLNRIIDQDNANKT